MVMNTLLTTIAKTGLECLLVCFVKPVMHNPCSEGVAAEQQTSGSRWQNMSGSNPMGYILLIILNQSALASVRSTLAKNLHEQG